MDVISFFGCLDSPVCNSSRSSLLVTSWPQDAQLNSAKFVSTLKFFGYMKNSHRQVEQLKFSRTVLISIDSSYLKQSVFNKMKENSPLGDFLVYL